MDEGAAGPQRLDVGGAKDHREGRSPAAATAPAGRVGTGAGPTGPGGGPPGAGGDAGAGPGPDPLRPDAVVAVRVFRGGPAIMANDLAGMPTSGITVQACGDAHLANFGLFGSPERDLVFTSTTSTRRCPAPWNGT